MNEPFLNQVYQYMHQPVWWGIGTIFIGIIGLSGWILGSRLLITIFPKSITIAPVSAFLFILLGICLCIISLAKSDVDYTIVQDILLIPPLLIGCWAIIDILSGYPALINWQTISSSQVFLIAPESQMSLISAILFVGLSLGMYLHQYVTRYGSGILLCIMGISVILIAGYGIGLPIFYGGIIKPISFLSAGGFFLAGTGFWLSTKEEN